MKLKKFIFLLLVLELGSNAFAREQSLNYTIGTKKIVKSVRSLLKEGTLDKKETCLDEYLNRHKQLVKMVSLGHLGGAAGAGAATATVIGFGALGGVAVGGVGALAFVGYEAYSITQLLQNRYLMKVISNARDGEGKSLKRFTKNVNWKNKDLNVSQSLVADMIVEADKNGTLCDGSIVRKSKSNKLTKIRHYLANKREILKYLGQKF